MGALSSFAIDHGTASSFCYDLPWIRTVISQAAYFLRSAGS